jgi:hypothetical protein
MPGAAQSMYGPPLEVIFLAACGVLPQRRQEAVILPANATNRERCQWDLGRRWDIGIPNLSNGYMVHEVPTTRRLVYEALALLKKNTVSKGSTVEETIQLCIEARTHHKFGYPTGEHVWSRAVSIVPTLPQRSRKPEKTMLKAGQAEAITAPMKNYKSLEPSKTD